MIDLKDITVTEISVHANPGSSITRCIREAALLAISEWQEVDLSHNDKHYKIRPEEVLQYTVKEVQ